ncbi:MAG TPA: hypothetical protein VF787_27470 [Thermoanaerobaculia bacterium]
MSMGRAAAGSAIGAALAAFVAPMIRPWFRVPDAGVGMITVNAYPKSWDYAVVALIVGAAFIGGAIASWTARVEETPAASRRVGLQLATAAIVFVAMLFMHDHPWAPMDAFHEGEHLTAGWLLESGERPYRDFYIFHGLAADAGLDALAFGDPPNPLHPRRLQTVLDAATIALLVPIAAEVTVTAAGLIGGVLLSLCACAALWLPVFPYFRLAPVLLAVWGLLRYVRTGRAGPLFVAFAASTLGLLWSLDVGLYAVAGTVGTFVLLRVFKLEAKPLSALRVLVLAAIAIALPILVLVAVRADLQRFLTDSFVVMPKAIDAVWALPAPAVMTANGVRYFLPLVFYGFALALALLTWRRGEKRLAANIAILIVFSLLLFRTAAGRVSWSHTRFAVPLLGIAFVAFVLEPLLRRRNIARVVVAAILAVAAFLYFEVRENVVAGVKLAANWRARQSTDGLVAYPTPGGKGMFTTPQNAADLAALQAAIDAAGPKDATIFDFSNERALYYLLQRKSPTRVLEVSMMSVPQVLGETMAELNANPPVAVIVRGDPALGAFDGVSNAQRVPDLAEWIDANYPKRTDIGRFTVATR